MLASPGAGKSHFIKCIANKLKKSNVSAINYNMSGLQRNEDLIPPLDAARNIKVDDQVPLLFLDEFDSRPENYPLLLPLLWDGELNLGQRDLRLGKVIIVLAGSDPSLPITMDQSRSMRKESSQTISHPKIIDLLSRINGGIVPIPSFYDPIKEIDRRQDKICIAIELLRTRFNHKLKTVPLALLQFIARVDFRYGVRSIAHLVDMIPIKKNATVLSIRDLNLPFGDPKRLKDSSLAYHIVHEEQLHGVIAMWKESTSRKIQIPVNVELLNRLPAGYRDEYVERVILQKIHKELDSTK